MTCHEIQELFSEYVDAVLDHPERVDEHLKGCGACQKEFQAFQSALRVLKHSGMVQASSHFTDRVIREWTKEREQSELSQLTDSVAATLRPPLWVRFRKPMLAAASVLVLVVGGWMALSFFKSTPPRVENKPSIVEVTPSPSEDDRMRELGFVRVNGRWFNAETAEGKIWDGDRWITQVDLIERRFKEDGKPPEVIAKAGGGTDPLPASKVTDEDFKKAGLERVGDKWVPKEYAEAMRQGKVFDGTRWVSPDELKAALHIDTPAQNRMVVVQNPAQAVKNVVTQTIQGLVIGAPVRVRNMTLYPISSPQAKVGQEYVSLESAAASNEVEVSETERASQVMIKNKSAHDITLLCGEILTGGEFDRVVVSDMVVPAKSSQTVPVYCVEPSRGGGGQKFQKDSGKHWAPSGIVRMIQSGSGQSSVWSAAQAYVRAFKVKGKATSLASAWNEPSVVRVLDEYQKGFEGFVYREKNIIGVAVVLNGNLNYVELVRDPEMFRQIFPKLVESAALTAEYGEPLLAEVSDSIAGVREFLEHAFYYRYRPASDAIGVLVIDQGTDQIGQAMIRNDSMLHTMVAPFATRERADGWKRDKVRLPQGKDVKFIKDFLIRMGTTNPAGQVALIHELASIQSTKVVDVLVRYLGDERPEVSAAAVEALTSYGDPAIATIIIDYLSKNRQNPAAVRVAVRALADMGDERAVEIFLTLLRGEKPDDARLVLEQLPKLLVQVKNPKHLVTSVDTLISMWDLLKYQSGTGTLQPGAPAWMNQDRDGAMASAFHNSLRAILGMNLDAPADYRLWWNKNKPR